MVFVSSIGRKTDLEDEVGNEDGLRDLSNGFFIFFNISVGLSTSANRVRTSSHPLPPFPPPVSPPYTCKTRSGAYQECTIPVRNPSIRSLPFL